MSEAEPRAAMSADFERAWRRLGLEDDFIPLEELPEAINARMDKISQETGRPVDEYQAFTSIIQDSGLYPHYATVVTAHYFRLLPSSRLIGDPE